MSVKPGGCWVNATTKTETPGSDVQPVCDTAKFLAIGTASRYEDPSGRENMQNHEVRRVPCNVCECLSMCVRKDLSRVVSHTHTHIHTYMRACIHTYIYTYTHALHTDIHSCNVSQQNVKGVVGQQRNPWSRASRSNG